MVNGQFTIDHSPFTELLNNDIKVQVSDTTMSRKD